MAAGGAAIGFWDGLAGPATGSFLVFWLVGLVGFGTATNVGALLVFGPAGVVLLGLGAVMAAANVAGSLCGARIALRRGSEFVRRVFLLVVSVLVLSLGPDRFRFRESRVPVRRVPRGGTRATRPPGRRATMEEASARKGPE